LPQSPGVQRSRGGLGRQRRRVRRLGVLQLEKAIDEFWMVLDGPRRQGILRVAAPCYLGREASGRQDQPHGGTGHGAGEGPARCRARQDETVDPLRVGNRQLLGHHPAQARPHYVGLADASVIEHRDDIAGHGGYRKQAGRPVAAAAPPVVHQHKPEVAPQFR
jgi:hypothetical protein